MVFRQNLVCRKKKLLNSWPGQHKKKRRGITLPPLKPLCLFTLYKYFKTCTFLCPHIVTLQKKKREMSIKYIVNITILILPSFISHAGFCLHHFQPPSHTCPPFKNMFLSVSSFFPQEFWSWGRREGGGRRPDSFSSGIPNLIAPDGNIFTAPAAYYGLSFKTKRTQHQWCLAMHLQVAPHHGRSVLQLQMIPSYEDSGCQQSLAENTLTSTSSEEKSFLRSWNKLDCFPQTVQRQRKPVKQEREKYWFPNETGVDPQHEQQLGSIRTLSFGNTAQRPFKKVWPISGESGTFLLFAQHENSWAHNEINK